MVLNFVCDVHVQSLHTPSARSSIIPNCKFTGTPYPDMRRYTYSLILFIEKPMDPILRELNVAFPNSKYGGAGYTGRLFRRRSHVQFSIQLFDCVSEMNVQCNPPHRVLKWGMLHHACG